MSRYFTIEQVSDRVWAAECQDPIWAMSNAAIVDLGEQTFVVDSSCSPQAAKELRALAEDLTQKRVGYWAWCSLCARSNCRNAPTTPRDASHCRKHHGHQQRPTASALAVLGASK